MTWGAYQLVLSARRGSGTTVRGPAMTAPVPLASDVNGVALVVLIALFLLVTVLGFMATRFRRGDEPQQPRRVGPRRSQVRHVGDLVPARRRPLHGVHVRRGAGGDVRDRRGRRVLRGALHDHPLPDHLHLHGAALVGQPPARLRDHRPTSCGAGTTHRGLSLAVAVTGFIATMPYIALQLVGIQAVLEVAGIGGGDNVPRQGPATVHRLRACSPPSPTPRACGRPR